jgi:hypothetical protein
MATDDVAASAPRTIPREMASPKATEKLKMKRRLCCGSSASALEAIAEGTRVIALAFVKREQFEIRSELEIVHIPTGADFRAYPYSDVNDMLQSVKVSWGRAGAPAGDYAEQVRCTASQLLLERAHQVSRDRRFLARLGSNMGEPVSRTILKGGHSYLKGGRS